MKRRTLVLLHMLVLMGMLIMPLSRAQAQAGNAYDLINGVNALRAANNLPAYSINANLMATAQAHADWILATGLGGHTGEGGSRPVDRAIAAGYGGGNQVYVIENWAQGYDLSVIKCIYEMWNDEAHMNTMLTTWHNEVGAGVAVSSSGLVIYILNVGHVTGNTIAQPTTSGTTSATDVSGTPAPAATIPFVNYIVTATPGTDGSVIHEVKSGDTLWTIADAYKIPLKDLLALNYMTESSAIYPGEKITIIPASIAATPQLDETAGTEETPTPTAIIQAQKPTQTAQPTSTLAPAPTLEATQPKPNLLKTIFTGDSRGIGIGLIAVCALGLILLLVASSRLKT